jgi:hypothetical protein
MSSKVYEKDCKEEEIDIGRTWSTFQPSNSAITSGQARELPDCCIIIFLNRMLQLKHAIYNYPYNIPNRLWQEPSSCEGGGSALVNSVTRLGNCSRGAQGAKIGPAL